MNRTNSTQPTANQPRLDWHSGFYAALKAELVDYLDMLQFEQEHSLNEQPLRIDVLVIKVLSDREIKKNIAKIFRGIILSSIKARRIPFLFQVISKQSGMAAFTKQ